MEWVDQESQFSVRDQEHVLVTLVRYVGLCPADDMGRHCRGLGSLVVVDRVDRHLAHGGQATHRGVEVWWGAR
jgi:uncharacterized protein involved in copper resistance